DDESARRQKRPGAQHLAKSDAGLPPPPTARHLRVIPFVVPAAVLVPVALGALAVFLRLCAGHYRLAVRGRTVEPFEGQSEEPHPRGRAADARYRFIFRGERGYPEHYRNRRPPGLALDQFAAQLPPHSQYDRGAPHCGDTFDPTDVLE